MFSYGVIASDAPVVVDMCWLEMLQGYRLVFDKNHDMCWTEMLQGYRLVLGKKKSHCVLWLGLQKRSHGVLLGGVERLRAVSGDDRGQKDF